MSSVDSRIVTMKFDNASFQQGAASTLSTLEKLKQNMNFGAAGAAATKGLGVISSALDRFGFKNHFAPAQQGIADLQSSANRFEMTGLTGGITGVSKSFLAMSTIAITALSNITSKAITTGTQLAKSLTVDPIKSGLNEYETNLNSVQTILANTKVSGATLEDVNKALLDLNHYSDKTIYNFSQMAKNIGTFTAAGVDLDTATDSIKGIANLAALSGSSSEQASSAMYQLSQEIAAGRVSLMGWNSVVNAGMGGSTFQRALTETAVAMGTINGGAVKLQGKMKNVTIDGQSFRDSIMAKPGEQSWLTSDVLTNTLKQFTGDMSAAELATQGFTDAQIKAIQAQAKTATDAATKVKTLSGVVETAKEVVGSGWAQTWQLVFGDFKEARRLFTNVSNTLNGFLGGMADARNELLGGWKDLGGRTKLIRGFGNAFEALKTILAPIRDAFRDIFPAKTAKDLNQMSIRFVQFTKGLAIGDETAAKLRRTFAGVFAIFSIVGQVISGVAGMFARLFGAIGDNSGGFLSFTGGVGDALVALDQFLEKSGFLEAFFVGLGNVLAIPLQLLSGLAGLIGGIFSGFDKGTADEVSGAIGKVADKAEPLANATKRIMDSLQNLGTFLVNIGTTFGAYLAKIGESIANSITPETFDSTLAVINTALLGGIVLILKKFFSGGLNIDVGGGLFESVKETLGAATDALTTMQAQVKADIILKIAAALALLTASLVILSTIDGKDLAKAFGAMVLGFAGLQVALIKLSTVISFIGAAKLPLITAAMVALAGALLLMALAVKLMATLELGDMLRGLFGLGAALFIINKAMIPLSANSGGMLRTSAAILVLAVALNALAIALKIFASMSWEEMAQGLAGVTGALLAIAVTMRLMPKGMVLQAAALVVLSAALNALGVALKIFASMSWEEIIKGLATLVGSLVGIAAAMHLMPKNMLVQAAALVAVATAMNILGFAIKRMAKMSWEEIAKGLVTLAGSLAILAAGLHLMNGTLMGSAALLVAAAALAILTPVLVTLGAMSWEMIGKGLATLAGVFVVLGLAGLILGPLVPVILGLAAALVLLGAGMVLIGAGALMFATAFGIFTAAGSAGIVVITSLIMAIINLIPVAMQKFAEGIAAFATVISKSGPQFVAAFVTVLGSLLDAAIKTIPKLGAVIRTLIATALRVVVESVPKMADAGLKLLIGLLTAIKNNIYRIITTATDIIVAFLQGIGDNLPRIVDAGVKMIIKFINGMAEGIRENSDEMGEAGANLATAVIEGMVKGLGAGIGLVKEKAKDVAKAALGAATDFLGINSPSKEFFKIGVYSDQGFANGLEGHAHLVRQSAVRVGQTALDALRESMSRVSDALSGDIDLQPVIAPVIDLTQFRKDAEQMSGMLRTTPITATASFDAATAISADHDQSIRNAEDNDSLSNRQPGVTLHYEQHNNSPKALSTVDIFRNTRNQLALAKEALNA